MKITFDLAAYGRHWREWRPMLIFVGVYLAAITAWDFYTAKPSAGWATLLLLAGLLVLEAAFLIGSAIGLARRLGRRPTVHPADREAA